MTGACRSLALTPSGPIDKIKASYSPNDKAVTAIRFFKKDIYVGFGKLIKPNEVWKFDDQNKLIGAHGYVDGDNILQLGFITHTTDNAACLAAEARESAETGGETTKPIKDDTPVN